MKAKEKGNCRNLGALKKGGLGELPSHPPEGGSGRRKVQITEAFEKKKVKGKKDVVNALTAARGRKKKGTKRIRNQASQKNALTFEKKIQTWKKKKRGKKRRQNQN